MPRDVTMPQLGMAQDAGKIVAWLKAPGDAVTKGDALFEVETDKATMEVEAQASGFLTGVTAGEGEDVPVGSVIAQISDTADATGPAPTAAKNDSLSEGDAVPVTEQAAAPAKAEKKPPVTAPVNGRILASPKARRLALEQGLDLALLVKAGHPQPFHVADLDTLRAIPADTAVATAAASMSLTAEIASDGFTGFAAWAAANGLPDADALLAGLAGASMTAPCIVAVDRFGQRHTYAVPAGRSLSAVAKTDSAPDLILRDLRGTALRSVALGATDTPVLTLMSGTQGLTITLECAATQMDGATAIQILTTFADRMEHPLHHLL